jgi:uncharacterized protein
MGCAIEIAISGIELILGIDDDIAAIRTNEKRTNRLSNTRFVLGTIGCHADPSEVSDLLKYFFDRFEAFVRALREPLVPADDSEDAKLLQRQGDEHEYRYLSKLKAEGRSVVEFDRDGGLVATADATRAALAQGPDVLFQGAFFAAPWGGWSDFLVRVQAPSSLGAFSYEVVDTKLKRKPDPKHILQLVLYSDLLAEVQGSEPEFAHIELGNKERFTFRLKEYCAYARHARGRLEDFVAAPPATSPEPVKMCGLWLL